MLDSTASFRPEAVAFRGDLTPPDVVSVSPARDIVDAVAEMERHFKEWEANAKLKSNKIG